MFAAVAAAGEAGVEFERVEGAPECAVVPVDEAVEALAERVSYAARWATMSAVSLSLPASLLSPVPTMASTRESSGANARQRRRTPTRAYRCDHLRRSSKQ